MSNVVPINKPQMELIPAAQQLESLKQIVAQKTPPEHVRYRDGRGGKKQAYVSQAYVTRVLNEAFLWDWSFEVDNEEILFVGERPYEVKCRGKLTVRMGERTIVKMQYGSHPIEFKKRLRHSGILGRRVQGCRLRRAEEVREPARHRARPLRQRRSAEGR